MTCLIYINDPDIHAHATSETEALPFLCILLPLCVIRRFWRGIWCAYGRAQGVLYSHRRTNSLVLVLPSCWRWLMTRWDESMALSDSAWSVGWVFSNDASGLNVLSMYKFNNSLAT
jgi:hypothetical protein